MMAITLNDIVAPRLSRRLGCTSVRYIIDRDIWPEIGYESSRRYMAGIFQLDYSAPNLADPFVDEVIRLYWCPPGSASVAEMQVPCSEKAVQTVTV